MKEHLHNKAKKSTKKGARIPFFRQRKNKVLILLLALCILLAVFARFPAVVEHYYAEGIYPFLSGGLRRLFGALPFSLGDLLYTLLGLFLLWRLFRFLRRIFTKQFNRAYAVKSVYTTLFIGSSLYLLFNVLWGLNYNRQGIAVQLHLEASGDYTTKDLSTLTLDLLKKTNRNRQLLGHVIAFPNHRTLFNEAQQAYVAISHKYPFLTYHHRSIKVPVYNSLGSFLGYTGYYNPFTGEAQVNTVLPNLLLPYVCCHEMAHQLGYATEDEANFVGFLSATASSDPLFQYSTNLELFRYANSELWYRDSNMAKSNFDQLHPWVKEDLKHLKAYFKAHENPFEKISTKLYGWFLKANQQPQGLNTYDEVTAWLLAYQKKYGLPK